MSNETSTASSGERRPVTNQQRQVYLAGLAQSGNHEFAARWAEISDPAAFFKWLHSNDSNDETLADFHRDVVMTEIELEQKLLKTVRESALNGDPRAAEFLLTYMQQGRDSVRIYLFSYR